MVTGIGRAIGDGFYDLMKLIVGVVIVLIAITVLLSIWYYHDEITIGNQAESALKVCESKLKRNEHCKLIIRAVPID